MNADYSIRQLSAENWQEFRRIRLEALQTYPSVFLSTYENEKNQPSEWWQDWLSSSRQCAFGLYNGKELVGITGIFTWREDPSGATGVMATSYIKPEHQGKGLSAMLYEARIKRAVGYLPWEKLVISHRTGNEKSRRAMVKAGFKFTHTSQRLWPDGKEELEYHYEMDLSEIRNTARKLNADNAITVCSSPFLGGG